MISDLCVWQPQPRGPALFCPLSRMHEAPFPLLRWACRLIQGAGAGRESGGLVGGGAGRASVCTSFLLLACLGGGRARLAPGSGRLCPLPHHCLTNTPQLAHQACQGPLDLSPLPFKAPRSLPCCTHAGAQGCSCEGLGTPVSSLVLRLGAGGQGGGVREGEPHSVCSSDYFKAP